MTMVLAALSSAPGKGVQAAAPQVTGTTPANGGTAVSVSTTVVFRFDQAMATSIPVVVSMPGFFVGNIEWMPQGVAFTCQWSGDGKSITCTPTGSLPANTTVSWRLNPAGTFMPIMSATGTALPTTTGSFQTGDSGGGNDCDPLGTPSGWGSYSVFKQGHYQQTSAGVPAPYPEAPFAFFASVREPAAGPAVTAASVALPGGASKTLQAIPGSGSLLLLDAPATLEALNAAYPTGLYTLRFTQPDAGEQVIPMSLPSEHPPVPHFTNYQAAQRVDVSQPFILQWDAFANAGQDDLLVLEIVDASGQTVFRAPDLCVPRELPVNATAVEIPPDTLRDDQTCTVTLAFLQRFYMSTTAIADMYGVGVVSFSTEMALKTGSGGAVDPAAFTGCRLLPNGRRELTLAGTPGALYTIQRTGSLRGTGTTWSEVGTVTMNGAGAAVFEDAEPEAALPLFYRAVAY